MTNPFSHVIVCSEIRKGRWSGKERQCCSYIRRISEVYIARVIFRVRLCLQPIKLNGLIWHALTRPDQVDIWNQMPLYAYWDEQIKYSLLYRDCRLSEKTGGFFAQQ